MNRESEQNSGRGGLGWVALVASAPLLYVLSLGPVGALIKNNSSAEDVARRFYYPVIWLDKNTPLKYPLRLTVTSGAFTDASSTTRFRVGPGSLTCR